MMLFSYTSVHIILISQTTHKCCSSNFFFLYRLQNLPLHVNFTQRYVFMFSYASLINCIYSFEFCYFFCRDANLSCVQYVWILNCFIATHMMSISHIYFHHHHGKICFWKNFICVFTTSTILFFFFMRLFFFFLTTHNVQLRTFISSSVTILPKISM